MIECRQKLLGRSNFKEERRKGADERQEAVEILLFSRDTMFKITIPPGIRRVLQENCIRRMPPFCSTADDPMRFLSYPPPLLFPF